MQYKTPLRSKKTIFHRSIRTVQKQTNKQSMMKQFLKSNVKNEQYKKFTSLCIKIQQDLYDQQAIEELKQMVKQTGFVISQAKCLQLHLILKYMTDLVISENNNQSYQFLSEKKKQLHQDKVSKLSKNLYQILKLIAVNLQKYQKHIIHTNKSLVETFYRILTECRNMDIKNISLKVMNFLVTNSQNKVLLIEKGLLKVFIDEDFSSMLKYVQILLSNLFYDYSIQLNKQNLDDLRRIFHFHRSLFQNEEMIEEFYHFVNDLFKKITDELANSKQFVQLSIQLLFRVDSLVIQKVNNSFYYSRILKIFFKKAKNSSRQLISNSNIRQLCIKGFQKILKIHQMVQQNYRLNLQQQQHRSQTALSQQQANQIVRCFSTVLEFCCQHLMGQSFIREYYQIFLNQMLANCNSQQRQYLSKTDLLRVIIKIQKNFNSRDVPFIIYCYQAMIEQKQIRIICLKRIIRFKRQEDVVTDSERSELRKVYGRLKEEQKDMLSSFLLDTLPYPTQEEISEVQNEIEEFAKRQIEREKQQQEEFIKRNKQCELDKQNEYNKDENDEDNDENEETNYEKDQAAGVNDDYLALNQSNQQHYDN